MSQNAFEKDNSTSLGITDNLGCSGKIDCSLFSSGNWKMEYGVVVSDEEGLGRDKDTGRLDYQPLFRETSPRLTQTRGPERAAEIEPRIWVRGT